MLIDTHAHLAARQFEGELPEIVSRATEAGVETIITIGSELVDSARNLEIADEFDSVFATVGVHPTSVHEVTEPDWIDRLREMTRHPKVVAIGEIGLDYFHPPQDGSPESEWRDRQERFFRAQLDLAEELDLPVVVHQRESAEDTLGVLGEYAGRVQAVLHCFTGTAEQLQTVLDQGNLVSFTGIVSFPKATDVQKAATLAPENRIMVETDAPYLAPVPFRGKRCEPAYVRHTAEHLARLREISLDELARKTLQNAKAFFRFPDFYK